MNAVIALCHFCEAHGPQVIMSTQFSRIEESSTPGAPNGTPVKTVPKLRRSSSNDSTLTKTKDRCEACQFIPMEFAGFVSFDKEAGLCYASRPHPTDSQTFSLVKDACIRSLSGEVSQTQEGPLFFGADSGLQVLGYNFFVDDAEGRGKRSSFGVLVAMRDAVYLLNSWPFLSSALERLVSGVKDKARSVCKAATTPHSVCRFPRKTTRSLRTLTGDRLLPQRLHAWFTWLLRAGAARLTERLMEGPPSEDTVIDWERQEETEEGYIHVHVRHLSRSDSRLEALGTEVSSEPAPPQLSGPPAFRNIRDIVRALGMDFDSVAYHTVVGNQVVVRCDDRNITGSFINAVKVLLPSGCVRLLYYSSRYEDTYRCNFLGLPLSVHVPEHAACSDYSVLVTLVPPPGWEPPAEEVADPDYSSWQFDVTSRLSIPDRVPTVLSRMHKAILDTHISPVVLQHCLICLKEEWMSKVKVFFKLSKDWGVSDGAGSEHIRRLLAAIDAQHCDWLLLKFWVQGLSAQLRLYMLSASSNHS